MWEDKEFIKETEPGIVPPMPCHIKIPIEQRRME
jgi:hypothetical protein